MVGPPPSGITWLDDDKWIGREIAFGEPIPSKWRIVRKVHEREIVHTEWEGQRLDFRAEGRGVFLCTNADGKEAVVKVRFQIPFMGTYSSSSEERAKQARHDMGEKTLFEIDALRCLTQAGCSSSPALLGWTRETQSNTDWVPGGYIEYILMERVPGVRPPAYWHPMDQEERDRLLKAFKEAYIECMACGRVHLDEGERNLIWDNRAGKCYIVDWEDALETTPKDSWHDRKYKQYLLKWD
ncbi:hypothetical protein BDV32DRAFT_118848 [Aspergillus pseudonomiae]|nr:hypothetical protein BDV32DRAFT_118848 [Aspergillus pseudonomiae]